MNTQTIDRDILVQNYADMIVDDMDVKTLMQLAYDVIVENLSTYSVNELVNEITENYDEEVLQSLVQMWHSS